MWRDACRVVVVLLSVWSGACGAGRDHRDSRAGEDADDYTDAAWDAEGPPTAEAGRARFIKHHQSDFDPYARDPSPEEQAWMRDHFCRIYAFAPCHDSRTSWHPDA